MAGGENIGGGYIEIGAEDDTDADVAAIEKKLIKELAKAGELAGKAMAKSLEEQAERAGNHMVAQFHDDARQIKKELESLGKKIKPKIEPELNAKLARAQVAYLQRDRIVNLLVRVTGAGKAAAEITALLKGISGANLIQNFTRSITDFATALPQVAAKTALLGSAISGLVVPILSATSALGPLAASLVQIGGLALAAPAGFLGAAAGVGVLISAFIDLENATTESGQTFYESITAIGDSMSALRQVIQGNFFDQFLGPFQALADELLPQLETGLAGLATTMGTQLGAVADGLTRAFGDDKLAVFFENLNQGVTNATKGMGSIAEALGNISTAGATLFPEFGSWITKIGDQFLAWTESADIAGIIRNAVDQTQYLFQSAGAVLDILKGIFGAAANAGSSSGLESLASTLQKIADVINLPAIQTSITTVFKGAASAASLLSDAMTPVSNAFVTLAPTISNLLATLGGGLASALTGLAQAFSSIEATNGINAMIAGLGAILQGIPWGAVGQAIGSIGEAFGRVGPLVSNLLNGLIPLISPLFDALAGVIGLLTGVPGAAEETATALTTLFRGIVDAALVALPAVIDAAGQLLPAIMTALLATLPTLMTGLGTLVIQIVDTLGQVIPQLIALYQEAYPKILPALVDALQLGFPVFIQSLSTLFLGIVEALSSVIPVMVETALGIMPQLIDTLVSQIPVIQSASFTLFMALAEGFLEAAPQIITSIAEFLPELMNTIVAMAPGLIQSSTDLFLQIITAFTSSIDPIIASLLTLLPPMQAAMIQMIPALVMAAVQLFLAIVQALPVVIPQIVGALGQMIPTLVNALTAAVPQFVAAGISMIAGLVQGLASQAGRVVDTVMGMASDAVNAFKNFLGIHSPSKVFEGFGYNIIQGLVKGLDKGRKEAASAAQRIAAKVRDIPNMGPGAKSTIVNYVTAQGKALDKLWAQYDASAKKLDDANKKLKSLKDARAQLVESVSNSLSGELDLGSTIATKGRNKGKTTFAEVAGNIKAMAAKIKAFAGKLKKLAAAGLPAGLIQQVAGLGTEDGAAVADALLSGSKAEIKKLSADFTGIEKWSKQAGDVVAGSMYDVGIAAQQGIVNGLTKDTAALKKAATDMANKLTKYVKQVLGIHSPSKVFEKLGAFTMAGYANGLESLKNRVNTSFSATVQPMLGSAKMLRPQVPSNASTDNSRTTTFAEGAFKLDGGGDPWKTATLVANRVAEKVSV